MAREGKSLDRFPLGEMRSRVEEAKVRLRGISLSQESVVDVPHWVKVGICGSPLCGGGPKTSKHPAADRDKEKKLNTYTAAETIASRL